LFCLISGQSSFLTAAMLIAIFALLDRRPVAAGILIGLLTIKPQLGILFPFMLITSGRWRVFIVAAVTALALAGATAAIFGAQVWIDFVLKGLPVQGLVLSDPDRIATPFFPTVFMNLRGLDLGYAAAMSVQALFSTFVLAAVMWAFRFRRDADPPLMLALYLACSVTPRPICWHMTCCRWRSPQSRFSPAPGSMRPAGAWCSSPTGPPPCSLRLGPITCRVLR
jgi:Glycosyltransferase family 87